LPAVNLIADDFVYQRFTTPSGVMIPYAYWLPEDYDPAKSYPMVVILPGQGQGFIPQASTGLNNEGVQVASDSPAVAWTQPQITGTDEDVIVLAPQNQRTGSSTVQSNVMVELVNAFAAQYSVDTDRIYVSTVSYGSTLAWAALVNHPGLFDAALITGGFVASAVQATAIAAAGAPVWVTHGTTDHLLNVVTTGQTSFNRIWEAYDVGLALTPAQTNTKIKYTEYPDSAFFEPDEHLAAAPTYEDETILQWLLAQ
jgi:predicted peptidase